MPAGRPSKPHKGEKIEYKVDEISLGDFGLEKNVENYFCKHSKIIMKQIFGEKVVSTDRQKRINGQKFLVRIKSNDQLHALSRCRAKIDVYIKCESGNNYALEFKNPHKNNTTDSIYAISQLLYYSTLLPEINRLVVVSTKYDDGFAEMIKKYNLPIDFILFAKSQMFLLSK
jgi:hypothetical protein